MFQRDHDRRQKRYCLDEYTCPINFVVAVEKLLLLKSCCRYFIISTTHKNNQEKLSQTKETLFKIQINNKKYIYFLLSTG